MKYSTLLALVRHFEAEYRMKDQVIFGNYKGFSFYLELDDKTFTHNLVINAKGDDNGELLHQLKTIAHDYENIDNLLYENGHICIHFLPYVEEKKTINSIIDTFEKTVTYLQEHGFTNACDKSSDTKLVELYETNKKQKLFLSESFAAKWNQEEVEKYNQEQKRPYRLSLALLLAFALSLIGGGLWVLVYKQENAAGASGFLGGCLIPLGAGIGYYLISKKFDRKSILSIIAISTIVIIAAQFFAFNYFAYDLLKNNGNFEDVVNFFDTLPHYELVLSINVYVKDLVFSAIIAVLMATIVIFSIATPAYFRKINAYGAKLVLTDIVYSDEEEEDEEEPKKDEGTEYVPTDEQDNK